MELDEMKTLWQETDRRLAAMQPLLRLNLRLAQDGARDRSRARLRSVRRVLWYEVAMGALAALLTGSYLADHLAVLRFALPAAALQLAALATLGVAIWQLVALDGIDYGGPVVSIQLRLARVAVVRARANRWVLLASPLLWAVLVVVVPHALVGLDVYRAFGVPWVAGNFAFGAAVLAVGAWLGRRLPASCRAGGLLRALGDDLAGSRLAAASAMLDDIAVFEREG